MTLPHCIFTRLLTIALWYELGSCCCSWNLVLSFWLSTIVLSFWLLLHIEHRLGMVFFNIGLTRWNWHGIQLMSAWHTIYVEIKFSCSKYSLLKVIVFSSIGIVDKGRPCLVINRNSTWFLVMYRLYYTWIHVGYNYSLHDLGVKLSFSWCLIMLITTTKIGIWQNTKIFSLF